MCLPDNYGDVISEHGSHCFDGLLVLVLILRLEWYDPIDGSKLEEGHPSE